MRMRRNRNLLEFTYQDKNSSLTVYELTSGALIVIRDNAGKRPETYIRISIDNLEKVSAGIQTICSNLQRRKNLRLLHDKALQSSRKQKEGIIRKIRQWLRGMDS